MKLYYPAIFVPYMGSFTVEFPDLPGCVTQGDSLEEAFEMAEDAACGWILTSIEDGEEIPSPSYVGKMDVAEGFINYITLDIDEYAKRHSTKAVKKTLTIPEWLNQLAEQQGINFSRELQNALKVRLGLTLN
ncbi:MAG: type II toxin-antitoxin system HicB family antitoxin [Lachnospiraceae bacterium]|nr:type II toxin-antitoxin system HicB family antitoxin [Lachnospiraceae bacterium]